MRAGTGNRRFAAGAAGAAVLALLVSTPASAQQEGACVEQSLGLRYDTRAAVAVYRLDATGCDPVEIVALEVGGRLERRPATGEAAERASLMGGWCAAGATCELSLAMPHPPVDWATYEASFGYHSTGPGPRLVAGAAAARAVCRSAVVVATCTLF